MRGLRILGGIVFVLGAVLLLNAANITGFAVLEGAGTIGSSIIGIVLVVVGILMWVAGRIGPRGEESLRVSNRDLQRAAEWAYRNDHHGHAPESKAELRDYMRSNFKTDSDRRELVEDYREAA